EVVKHLMDWDLLAQYFSSYGRNIADILIVAFLIYQVYRRISHTRAVPVIIGFFLLFAMSYIARLLHLDTLRTVFDVISGYLVIALIVVLQQELRRFFYQLGQTKWYRAFVATQQVNVEEILSASTQMAEEKIGALIVLVNKQSLAQLVDGGIELDAILTRELLVSIFYEGNPLHDGAVIIEGERIVSAANYLPLSNSSQLKRTMGARHRSGLGISEESDAFVIIVSEEKGRISVCFLGNLKENINAVELKSLLGAFNANRLEEEWKLLFEKDISSASDPSGLKKKNRKGKNS
ncbi:MAG: TIGR00159 family protein, partial [Candidatus Hydrogenedentota bacterium]